ncbi:ATPase AAA-type core domain-containing protein [Vibrio crassostreae]|nr:ATPase AAA-type core domain-containing protein [Vibrio crassostreae]
MKKVSLDVLELSKQSTIFIGENGGGKSTVLRQLLEHFNSQGRNIIAISNCLNDKFDVTSKNINYMSAKYGDSLQKSTLSDFLSKIDEDITRSLSRVLSYCGYSEVIGFKVSWGVESSLNFDNYVKVLHGASGRDGLLWIPINSSFPNYRLSSVVREFFSNISSLIDDKIVNSVDFFLEKNMQPIDFRQISSGESSQILTLAFISANINEKSVILVDEPENSLHPKWQREYIGNIFNLFYQYDINLFVSTHSPLFINEFSDIYEVNNFELFHKSFDGGGIEEILWDLFEIVTPENEFLSRYLVKILDDYKAGAVEKESTLSKLVYIKEACIDRRQLNVVDDLYHIINNDLLD